jgi:hypothetical protein
MSNPACNLQCPNTYTHAPMKLLYEFAFALHMLLPKQIKDDAINTGRLPQQLWIGTLEISTTVSPSVISKHTR